MIDSRGTSARWVLAAALAAVGLSGCSQSAPVADGSPRARRVPHRTAAHGVARTDDYHWLRDETDPAVLEHLEAENAYAESVLSSLAGLTETLADEMRFRLQETDSTVPYLMDGYWYYDRTEAGQQYVIHCRRPGTLDAAEQIILDENELAADSEYFSADVISPSPDGRLLAYAVDHDALETYTLLVKDLATGTLLADEIQDAGDSVEWAADNRTLFYTLSDEAYRVNRVYRHTLGEHETEDDLIYEETDERFHVSLSQSRSRKYVFIESHSNVASELRILPTDDPRAEPRVIFAREEAAECYADHQGDDFLLLTNGAAPNFRLLRVPTGDTAAANRREVLPHREDVVLEGVECFAGHLVLHERRQGRTEMRVMHVADGTFLDVAFDEPYYTLSAEDNAQYDAIVYRFGYSSFVTPYTIYEIDLATGVRTLRKQEEVLGGYRAEEYVQERLEATAADGTRVPITLVRRRDLSAEESHPLLLYGYGAYGISIDPDFDSARLSLLERGVIFAVAHVRGGGDLGRDWYRRGKLLDKPNTFADFIACAEHLIDQGYTRPGKLAALGESAGGLLIGAVANQRPELFRCLVAKVPFVDALNTMLDRTVPLTVIEYDEWGDPAQKPFYDCIAGYSPYDNVRRQAYPDMLVTSGLRDPRVQYWEPAKWVARLRAENTGQSKILLVTNLVAGHSGASGRYDAIDETAREYAFVLDRLGNPSLQR